MFNVSRNSPSPHHSPIREANIAGAQGGGMQDRIRRVSQSSDTSHTTSEPCDLSLFQDWTLQLVNGEPALINFTMTPRHRLADGSFATEPSHELNRDNPFQVEAHMQVNGNIGHAEGTFENYTLTLSTQLTTNNPPEYDSPSAMEHQHHVLNLFTHGIERSSIGDGELILSTVEDYEWLDTLKFTSGISRPADQSLPARYHALLESCRYPQSESEYRGRKAAIQGLTRLHMSGELDIAPITPDHVLGEWYVKMVNAEDFYPRVKLTWEQCEDGTLELTRDYKTEIAGGKARAISKAKSTIVGAGVKTEEESSPSPFSEDIRNFLFWDETDLSSPLTEFEQKVLFDRTVVVSSGSEYLLFVTGEGKSVLLEKKGVDPYLTCRHLAQWKTDLDQFSAKSATIDHSARTDEISHSGSGNSYSESSDDQGFSEISAEAEDSLPVYEGSLFGSDHDDQEMND